MDIGELRFARVLDSPGADDVQRRYRFMLGGQEIDAVLTEAAATVWHQTHPDATPADLDDWAVARAEDALRARLTDDPLNFGELTLDSDVGADRETPGRYGEDGVMHR